MVSKAQAGNHNAFHEVCRRFEGLVKRQAYKSHLRSLGEDALAEGWLAVAEAVKSYDRKTGVPFAGYVESKVKYALWNLFKRERRRWRHEIPVNEGEDENSPGGFRLDLQPGSANIEVEIELMELGQQLEAAIKALPERQRQALVLTMFGDNKLAEAAVGLGITAQGVHNLRQRALTRLKRQLAGMYVNERG